MHTPMKAERKKYLRDRYEIKKKINRIDNK